MSRSDTEQLTQRQNDSAYKYLHLASEDTPVCSLPAIKVSAPQRWQAGNTMATCGTNSETWMVFLWVVQIECGSGRAGGRTNEEPIHSKCSPVVVGSRKNGNYLVKSMWGKQLPKTNTCSVSKKSKTREARSVRIHALRFSFLLCYFEQEKQQAHFAAQSPTARITVALLRPPPGQVGWIMQRKATMKTTNKCKVKYLNLMCI